MESYAYDWALTCGLEEDAFGDPHGNFPPEETNYFSQNAALFFIDEGDITCDIAAVSIYLSLYHLYLFRIIVHSKYRDELFF